VWIGSGLDGIDGLAAGDPVTRADASLVRLRFASAGWAAAAGLEGPDLTLRDFQNVSRLGVPFKIVDNDLIPFRVDVAQAHCGAQRRHRMAGPRFDGGG
jgi:hypothetical protein